MRIWSFLWILVQYVIKLLLNSYYNRDYKTNKHDSVHYAFLYISLPSLHDYNVKLPQFHVLSRTGTKDNNFLFLFLNFDAVLFSTPKKFAKIRRKKKME